jgi:integrase
MVFPVHLQRSAVVAIVDCPDHGQFIGSLSLKQAAPQWICLFQRALRAGAGDGWIKIIRPPRVRTLPDIPTREEVQLLINTVRKLRYRIFQLVVYSLGLRITEGLALEVADIHGTQRRVHIRDGKGGKDRYVPMPPASKLRGSHDPTKIKLRSAGFRLVHEARERNAVYSQAAQR